MADTTLKSRMLDGDMLSGTFLKTPAFQLIEILAMSGMDFVALDAEHAPFDRGSVDACLGMARALNFPALVRIPDGSQAQILTMLDSIPLKKPTTSQRPRGLGMAGEAMPDRPAGPDMQHVRCPMSSGKARPIP